MPVDASVDTSVTASTPPIGSMSLPNGSTMAVPSDPSNATSSATIGLAASPVTGRTSTRASPVAGTEPWVMVYGT